MDMISKSVDATVKPIESEHPNGEFEVVLSTDSLDRDGERLYTDEWKQPLPEKIHIDGDHGRSLEKTVGSAIPRIEGNKLIGKGKFAGTAYAQMVRQLVTEGHIGHVSVTYGEQKCEKDGKPQRELFNAAFVAIPANLDAVVLSSKSAKDDDEKKPYGNVAYADPKNGKYPLDTEAHVRSAWSYINMPKNANQYSGDELSLVKGRIRSAAKKFGIEISDDDGKKSVGDVEIEPLTVKAAGGLSASGDNPSVPKHDEMVQAIHDAACHLGAQCLNEIEADPGTADGANKSVDKYTSSGKTVGLSQESAEESAAAEPAEKSAGSTAADESADDATRERLAAKARSLAFLTTQNSFRSNHAQ